MTRDSRSADNPDKVTALVDAALEAFAGAGLEGTRVDAIARAAGMNKRLLYHYVGDKAALFDAAANAAVARLLATRPPGNDPLAWRVLSYASAAGRCPDLTALLAGLSGLTAAELCQRLLAGLLPELGAVAVRESVQGSGDAAASPPTGSVPSPAAQPKPRIKLRPNLASAVATADRRSGG
ncbi:MAG: TetR/AcrR family transcriptional regulator [Pseudomonadales bacterium]